MDFFHDLPIRVKNNRTAKIDLKIDPKWPGLTWGFLCAWAFWRFVRRLNVFGQLLRWAISSRKGHDWFQIVGWELTAFQFWHWPTYTQHRYLLIREDRDFEFINYKRAHAKKKIIFTKFYPPTLFIQDWIHWELYGWTLIMGNLCCKQSKVDPDQIQNLQNQGMLRWSQLSQMSQKISFGHFWALFWAGHRYFLLRYNLTLI